MKTDRGGERGNMTEFAAVSESESQSPERNAMKLTAEETAIRDGQRGAGAAKAMGILYNLGRIAGATEMVPVGSVQVSGVSYKNIGEYGLAFLEEWAALGGKAVVPAFMNPGGADRKLWERLGIPAEFVAKQQRVQAALEALGIAPLLSCTPYHAGCTPAYREHVAWAESSAVCYANSVLGARTNREGGPSAIAAALTGRTPKHTLHTDEGRVPTRFVTVRCKVLRPADAGALGYLIGKAAFPRQEWGRPLHSWDREARRRVARYLAQGAGRRDGRIGLGGALSPGRGHARGEGTWRRAYARGAAGECDRGPG